MKKILIILFTLITSVGLFSQPLSVNTTNNRYFTYKGVPTIIGTSGEHYGAVLNMDFDYVTYAATLVADQLNGTRIQSGANPEYQGWYNIDDNTWAPGNGRYACPWVRSATPGYYGGGNKFDLTQYDESYFARLIDFMDVMDANDILVELTFYTNVYTSALWDYNPMKLSNNINSVGNYTNEGVYDDTNDLFDIQMDLVQEIVTRLNDYDNLFWEICNEPYIGEDRVPDDWQDSVVTRIINTELFLPKKHLISENTNNFYYTLSGENPDVDIFNLHYANARSAYTNNQAYNKILGCNETGFDQQDNQYVNEFGIALWSGAALFNNLDYSITVGDEEGINLPSGNPAGGSVKLRHQYGFLKRFFEGLDFIQMAPDNTWVNDAPDDMDIFGMSWAGEQYSAFIIGVGDDITLTLPANEYSVEWMNTRTGIVTYEPIDHAGGNIVLNAPVYIDNIMLRVMKKVNNIVEKSPVLYGTVPIEVNGQILHIETGTSFEPYVDYKPRTERAFTKIFDQQITMVYEPAPDPNTGQYGFYWWHRPDEYGFEDMGDMPAIDWTDYWEGEFIMTYEIISQPTSDPIKMQFGLWGDYSKGSLHTETVAERMRMEGGAGSKGSFSLGMPREWWQKQANDTLDFSRMDDLFRIGVVLWDADADCIPKGLPWGDDGCPELAPNLLPLVINVKIEASTDPKIPDPVPPDPEWEDSVAFNPVFFEDFQDFPITNTITADFPIGIHDDTVAKYFENFRAVENDETTLGHGDPDYASNMDIVDFNSIKVVQSWYLINRCCGGALFYDGMVTDPDTDPAYIPGGTGFQVAAWFTDQNTHYRKLIWHQWVYFPKAIDKFGLFENSQGFKMPSAQLDIAFTRYATSSYMILDYSSGTNLDPAYYNGAWWDNWTEKYTKSNTKTKTPETWFTPGWHLISKYQDAGTTAGSNGVNHMYIDGKLIDDGAGGGILSSIPYLRSTDPAGFNHLEWRGFMGGYGNDYISPKTQTLYFGPFGAEVQPDYDETPIAGQDIYIPKYMKELGLTWSDIPDNYESIFSIDFELSAIQDPYSLVNIQNEWPWETNWTDGRGRTSYVGGSSNVDNVAIAIEDNSRVMLHRYGADKWGVGTSGLGDGTGINGHFVWAKGYDGEVGEDEVYFSFNVKFSAGFDWGLGGKLPGVTANPYVDGGHWPPDQDEGGFNIMMWQPDGYAKLYDYVHVNEPYQYYYEYGRGPNIGATFVADVWYNVTQRSVQSDPIAAGSGAANGIHEVFINGVLVYSWTGILTREFSYIHFNAIEFATFQGGGEDYQTPGAHEAYFDDIDLWKIIGTGSAEHPVGNVASPLNRDISDYIIQK